MCLGHTYGPSRAKIQAMGRLPRVAMLWRVHLLERPRQRLCSPAVNGHAGRFQHDTMDVVFIKDSELHVQKCTKHPLESTKGR
jgi:hypothetical protein